VICSNCGNENRDGRKFCSSCGTALSVACPSCGAGNEPGDRFCGDCGAPLSAGGVPAAATAARDRAPAASERRVVSVLFADLVGFTTLSESQDAEEVRELLTRYFDTCRKLIVRYGGSVEKFIGDAVMAVWGTPVAQEDDAERAVRAALDLVDAVHTLGQESGNPQLRVRAGVLTGEAAVTVGATGEGMVAGDLVNTASRIQSAAEPGSVFVGESTRRATDAAIVYEDAGMFELKGKTEAMQLWRAGRIVSGVRGALKAEGLEAPFVGRDRELRLIKELFHASADEGKARLVSVVGIAGIGKSRLGWEFYKYMDGLQQLYLWHRGRCLAYGEGVTYWALVEMIRMRADILEGEDAVSAAAKLHATVELYVKDPEERRWVEPRLAHLLGLEDKAPDRESLFAAWRLFIERMTESSPVILAFEDMQWADAALLDFIEYLLEWSRNLPIFVIVQARPDLLDRRPTWGGGGSRNATTLSLEPLPDDRMRELLAGLVPGLPDELRDKILARAEGVPLYAIETVRMLLDRGLLVLEGSIYRPTGPIESLEIPETLHALIAARLDGLAVEERRLLQDASVLGKNFTRHALAMLSGRSESEIDPLLSSLVRKEVLSIQVDPRSPERGQYGFLQDLVKFVAYEMLSKKDRKTAHLAAAAILEGGTEEEEIVEVVASHYLDAYRLAPDAADAAEIKKKACYMLTRAAERASSLAALAEAERYYVQAAEHADEPAAEAALLERAATAARGAGNSDAAAAHLERAGELCREQNLTHLAARITARLAEVMWDRGKMGQALEDMDRALKVLQGAEPDEDLAALFAQLGKFLYFNGQNEMAMERIETAIDIAEGLLLPEILSNALNTKAVMLYSSRGRVQEGYALLKYALEIALENDLPSAALRGYYNLADLECQSDQYTNAPERIDAGLALARRVGNQYWEWNLLGQLFSYYALGEWDRAVEQAAQQPVEKVVDVRGAFLHYLLILPRIAIFRGDLEQAKRYIAIFPNPETSGDIQERASYFTARAIVLRAEGDAAGALEAAEQGFSFHQSLGLRTEVVKESFIEALEAALEIGDLGKAEELISVVEQTPRGQRPRYLEAHSLRFRARLSAARADDTAVEARFKSAAGMFVELAAPFWAAVTRLEHAEWLAERGRTSEAQPLLADATPGFERLRAAPFVARAKNLVGVTIESL
jgi:class 3 adenylate cyclase/tetratricopeptide (TPR) repeat protein